jgi:hypothetical protein
VSSYTTSPFFVSLRTCSVEDEKHAPENSQLPTLKKYKSEDTLFRKERKPVKNPGMVAKETGKA